MRVKPLYFQAGTRGATSKIVRRLLAYGFTAHGSPEVRRETYLDSFDWLFYGQSACLVESDSGGKRRLEWLSLPDGNCLAVADAGLTPRFAADLPDGPLASKARPLLGCRALIPLARRVLKRREFRLLDRRQKTVLRLQLETSRVARPGAAGLEAGERGKALTTAVRLLPVKGYDDKLAEVRRWLQQELGLTPVDKGFVELTLRAAGHAPGSYSSRVDVTLDPGVTAEAALYRLLRSLWKAAEENEAGVIGDIDSEFLHDFRVAVRRTRSALSQMKGVFQDEWITPFRDEFYQLAAATGPTRDLDVYLLALPGYEAMLSPEYRPGLAPLKALLTRRRALEFAKLGEILASPGYTAFKGRWTEFLRSEKPEAPHRREKAAMAELPVGVVAGFRIWRLYRKLLKGGRAITPDSPATDLHELRKQAKKLRYMFEFFKSLYPGNEVAAILKVLKILQQNLGDIQDLAVQADSLAEMAKGLEKSGEKEPLVFMAIGMLTAHLTEVQKAARAEFASVFSGFDTPDTHRLFRRLFKQGTGGRGKR